MEISGEYHGLGYITNNLIYPICYGDTPKMDGSMENTIFSMDDLQVFSMDWTPPHGLY